MSTAPASLSGTRTPTVDRLALLELLGAFVILTPVFGILAARVVDDSGAHGYTARGLTVGFVIGAGIALALVIGMVLGWPRTGGRPAQRRASQAWRTGVLPSSPAERALLLRSLERHEKILARGGLSPTVLAVIWVVIALFQITSAPDPLTPIA